MPGGKKQKYFPGEKWDESWMGGYEPQEKIDLIRQFLSFIAILVILGFGLLWLFTGLATEPSDDSTGLSSPRLSEERQAGSVIADASVAFPDPCTLKVIDCTSSWQSE